MNSKKNVMQFYTQLFKDLKDLSRMLILVLCLSLHLSKQLSLSATPPPNIFLVVIVSVDNSVSHLMLGDYNLKFYLGMRVLDNWWTGILLCG